MAKTLGLILIIEDDHDIRVSFRQSLEQLNYDIISTANGSDALKLLKKSPRPDLIILDMHMPIMDGEDFLEKKNEDPHLKNIPVLIVTAHSDKYEFLDTTPHLKKPVDMQNFIDQVLSCLKTAALND